MREKGYMPGTQYLDKGETVPKPWIKLGMRLQPMDWDYRGKKGEGPMVVGLNWDGSTWKVRLSLGTVAEWKAAFAEDLAWEEVDDNPENFWFDEDELEAI